MIKLLNKVQGWFAHIRLSIGSLFFGNRIYHNELIIVCSAIEKVYTDQKKMKREPEELSVVKARIRHQMERQGIDGDFHDLLVKHGLSKAKKTPSA